MLRFATTTLADGKLTVTGTCDRPPGARVSKLTFVVSQGDVMVMGDGTMHSGGGWDGTVSAGELQLDPAQAVGIAVVLTGGEQPNVASFTWAQQVTLTQGEATA
jgi:hypothetical protein